MSTSPPPSGIAHLEDSEGYDRTLKARHIRMIAISGAIGTGLFLGSGGSIAKTGPGLIFTYALTGVFIFFIMRALGELLLYRPVSGSIGAYAAEFLGRAAGFCTGWGYWVTWSVIGMAEITAAGIYVRYWFPAVPQWLTALVVLVGLLVANLISVRAFGEFEFWFSVIKVSTILVVVVGGTLAVVTGFAGHQAGFSNLWDEGGFAPHGWLPVLVAVQLAVFSFQGVELVGMTAGEAKDPHTVLPKAINSIVLRIAVFYVAAVTVLVSVLPWTSFHSGESPFVQVFGHLGIPGGAGALPVWAAAFAVAYLLHRRRGARPAVRSAEPSSAEPSTAGLPD